MATKVCPNFLYMLQQKEIDVEADTFIIILMQSGFVYDRATHHVYADISTSELGSGNGYTIKTKTLTGVALSRNDTLYKTTLTWSNPSWTASGGSIGPSPGAFILDDTATGDPLACYIDFGGEGTEPDGGTFTISSPKIEIGT